MNHAADFVAMVLAGQSNHAGSNCNLDMAVGCAMVVEILKKWKHE